MESTPTNAGEIVNYLLSFLPSLSMFADWLGILGFFVTILAWLNARKARTVALETKQRIDEMETVERLFGAIHLTKVIRDAQRSGEWEKLVPLYTELRGCLIRLRSLDDREPQPTTWFQKLGPNGSDQLGLKTDDSNYFQGDIAVTRELERSVNAHTLDGKNEPKRTRIDGFVAGIQTNLEMHLSRLKSGTGVTKTNG